jgi:hypothetical protein
MMSALATINAAEMVAISIGDARWIFSALILTLSFIEDIREVPSQCAAFVVGAIAFPELLI